MPPQPIITLTTDFGLIDSYVGIMKGVILGIAPQAQIVDISHSIKPQNIHQAAYVVQTFYSYFPAGSIHVVVVDPGVGSTRHPIVLSTPEANFVAPDNGVLSYVWRDVLARWGAEACTVIELNEPRYWLPTISNTFHGRDIFAPVAAQLACGLPLEQLGRRQKTIVEASIEEPVLDRRGELLGRIIHIDYFGNCVSNIEQQHLAQFGGTEQCMIKVLDQRISALTHTYAEHLNGSLLALIGSTGRLEIAVSNGNAAKMLGLGIGDKVRVRRMKDEG